MIKIKFNVILRNSKYIILVNFTSTYKNPADDVIYISMDGIKIIYNGRIRQFLPIEFKNGQLNIMLKDKHGNNIKSDFRLTFRLSQ